MPYNGRYVHLCLIEGHRKCFAWGLADGGGDWWGLRGFLQIWLLLILSIPMERISLFLSQFVQLAMGREQRGLSKAWGY